MWYSLPRRVSPVAMMVPLMVGVGEVGEGERLNKYLTTPTIRLKRTTDGPSGLPREPAQEDVDGAAAGASAPVHDATLNSRILQLEE
ncbi:hypothetical protein BGAL_0010g00660 [Botrytis galanthina]|uniref:Uncharacterized protein n=1 Tax=Botrytis galanthina TaxID=278940 RepID=A0A4V4HW07_9HELO|nr:hypothetical protein BGAL_0010g00660 [Botrytis galanthina]